MSGIVPVLVAERRRARQHLHPQVFEAAALQSSASSSKSPARNDASGTTTQEIAGGEPFAAINRFSQSKHFDLVSLGDPPGTYGSPFYPWFLRSQHLSERLASSPVKPLLIARANKPRLNNILFGSSGEEPARRTLEIGAKLISNTGAKVSILHVMSQLAFENSRFSDDLYYNAETAIKSGSREGIHLSKAIEILTLAGIKSKAVPRLRHGLVLDEMMTGIKEQLNNFF